MKIGITGATGQLGRIVIEKLQQRVTNAELVALVRSPQKASDLGVEARAFDYGKPEILSNALEGIDKLLLISGNEIGKRVEQHANVVEAAKKAGVKLMVYTSLLRVDRSTLVLADEHKATEKILKESGVPYVVLRNGWYSENYTASVADVVATGTLYGSSGEGRISSASREDYAEAAVVVLTTDNQAGRVYELAGDQSFTMSDFAAEIARQTGKDISYVNVPVEEYTNLLIKAGMPEAGAQFFAGTHVSTEKGDLFDDQHQLSKLIGRPTTPVSESIAEALKK